MIDEKMSQVELDNSSSGGRVQIWKLRVADKSPQWKKDGCGLVTTQFTNFEDSQSADLLLVVYSEDNGQLILREFVSSTTEYDLQGEKQKETMIVWYVDGMGHCLSFEKEKDCKSVWQKIKDTQAEKRLNEAELAGDEDFDEIEDFSIRKQMPPCELSKLDEIKKILETVATSQSEEKKKQFADMIETELYISQLINIFRMCEDLENTEGLHTLFGIFKSLFNLEKHSLFSIMFQGENIMDIVGILEYDPGRKERTPHREYLNEIVRFKEVIPIYNEELLHKIHQTYRVQYIKDILVPIPSLFDEGMSTLSSFIYFNKLEICTLIQEDTHFLEVLFEKLTDDEISDGKRKEAILLLRELCTYSQSMQIADRDMFIKTLSNHGLLQTIDQLMNIDDVKMRGAMIDIIFCVVEFNPSLVRTYLCKEVDPLDEDSMLLNTLIDILLSSDDKGQGVILLQLIKTILDPGNMDLGSNKTEKSEFLSFFYRHCMHTLTAPILAVTATDKLCGKDDFKRAAVLDYIVDILTFCVEQRHFPIRNYLVSKDMLRRVLVLMQSRHKFLSLAALRFCRKIIGLQDDVLNRCIIVGKLIKPIVEAFVENGKRYNLLNSAILELFEFIKVCSKENLKIYIAENHLDAFRNVSYVTTFVEIERHYEQYKDRIEGREESESRPTVGIIHSFTRKKPDERAMDQDEECWFESEDDQLTDISTSVDADENIDKKDDDLFENLQPITQFESPLLDNGIESSDKDNETVDSKTIESSYNHIHQDDVKPKNTLKPLTSQSSSEEDTVFTNTWKNKTGDKNKVIMNSKLINKQFLPIKITSTNLSLKSIDENTQNGVTSHNNIKNGLPNDKEVVHSIVKTKPLLTSLVDYPDDDDDDDDDDDNNIPSSPAKKQRLSPT